MNKWLGRFALLSCSTVVALLVAELAVSNLVPVRNVGPSFSEYHPVYGQALKKNFSCRRYCPEFEMTLTTNSLGFRGSEPSSEWRKVLLFLGDSFTMGYGVNDGEEYPSLVGDALKGGVEAESIGVVNVGRGNIGNGYWVKFLQTEAEQYQPDFVVLQVCINDFGDNLRERLFTITADGDLESLEVPPPGARRRIQEVVDRLPFVNRWHMYGLLRQLDFNVTPDTSTETPESDVEVPDTGYREVTYALIRESVAICRQHGWPVVVFAADVDEEIRDELSARCSAIGVDLISLPHKSDRPDLFYKHDDHWNSTGHRTAARLCADYINGRLIHLKPPAAMPQSQSITLQ